MTEMQALAVVAPRPSELTVAEVLHSQSLVQQVMREVMNEGHHYGSIPGTEIVDEKGKKKQRMALLKPGAEKLCMVFRLAPTFTHTMTQLQNGHREYRVDCTLTHIASGNVLAQSPGSCSTMESKYRWRNSNRKCPDCGAEAIMRNKDKTRDGYYCWAKKGGCGANFRKGDARIEDQKIGRSENPDIADVYNTCLKMATKRALVGATLLATAASDMFVPDDDEDEGKERDEQEREDKEPQQQKTRAELDAEKKAAHEHRDLLDRVAVGAKKLGWDWTKLRAVIGELQLPVPVGISAMTDEHLRTLLKTVEGEADMVPGKGA